MVRNKFILGIIINYYYINRLFYYTMPHYNPTDNQNLHNILTYENNIMASRSKELHQILISLQKHMLYMNNFLMNRFDISSGNPEQIAFVNINTYDNSGNLLSSVTSDNSGNFVPVLSSDASGNWIPCVLPPDLSNNHMFTRGVVPHADGTRGFPYYPYGGYPYYGFPYHGYPYGGYPYHWYPYYGNDDYDYRSLPPNVEHNTSISHPVPPLPPRHSPPTNIHPMAQHIHIHPHG